MDYNFVLVLECCEEGKGRDQALNNESGRERQIEQD